MASSSVDGLGLTAMISEDALPGEGHGLSAVANVKLGRSRCEELDSDSYGIATYFAQARPGAASVAWLFGVAFYRRVHQITRCGSG